MATNSIKYIPRAIYYMDIKTPLISFCSVLFGSSWKKQSSFTEKFKNEIENYLGAKNVILSSHARISFFHILNFLSLPADSEIISTPINLPEMLKMIRINKLKINFIGYKNKSYFLDFENLKINSNTKVFFYTPIAGIHTDMYELALFCKKNNLILIQDLTQSFGAHYNNKPIHEYGDFNFYSLCDLKTLHTHRGSIVFSKNSAFNEYMKTQSKIWFKTPSKKYFLGFIAEDFISILLLNRWVFNYFSKWILFVANFISPQLIEKITSGHLSFFMASGNEWTQNEIPPEQKYLYTDLQANIGLDRIQKVAEIDLLRKNNILLFYSLLNSNARQMAPRFDNPENQLFWRAPMVVDNFLKFQSFMLQEKIDVARSNLPWLPDLLDDQKCNGREMKYSCVYMPIYHYLSDAEVRQVAHRVNEYAKSLD